MTRTSSLGKRLSICAILLTFSIIISYIESITLSGVFFLNLPGFKPGLSNIVIMFTFFNVSKFDAFVISLLRVIIMGMLFGNPYSFMFSVFGAFFAFLFLIMTQKLYDKYVSFIGISVGCAALHNIGQIFAATILFSDTAIFIYLPWLLIVAVITGTLSGILTNLVNLRLKKVIAQGVR